VHPAPSNVMSLYTLKRVQQLPISLEEAWDFFSAPANLKVITPAYMGFEIRSEAGPQERMYAGQVITYTVRPLLGLPVLWMTEITHVEGGRYFIDEQRVGPYRIWHHQHHFRPLPSGVEMTDLVHYQLPLGPLGQLAHALFVKGRLREIFDFRERKLRELFG
jgi:ligand-binding SRPBCC domain-containing protein